MPSLLEDEEEETHEGSDMEPDDEVQTSRRCCLLQRLRVEPVILISMIVFSTSSVAMQQLMQDKLCISKHSQDHEYCTKLSEKDQSAEKFTILADVAFYSSLREYISVVPRVVLLLLIGSWCDKFPSAKRCVMLASMIGLLLDSALLLINSRFFDWDYRLIILCNVPSAFLCNGLSMAISSYITSTTEQMHRSQRFLLLDVFTRAGIVIGFLASGAILASAPMLLSESGTKNHSEVFLINLILSAAGFVWVFYRIEVTADANTEPLIGADNDTQAEGDDDEEEQNERTPLFSWNVVRETSETLTRTRPSQTRRNLWLLLFVYSSIWFPMQGLQYIFYPLSELLYKWDIQTYSFTIAMFEAVTAVTLSCFMFVVKKIKIRPTAITMIGLTSSIMGYICIGSITSVNGFYLNGIAASLTPAAASGIRSFLSLIIPENEITKVYSLTLLIETGIGFVSPSISSFILKETISSFPTLIFHFYASLLIVTLIIVAVMDVTVRSETRMSRILSQFAPIDT
jgi:hypothetical protein